MCIILTGRLLDTPMDEQEHDITTAGILLKCATCHVAHPTQSRGAREDGRTRQQVPCVPEAQRPREALLSRLALLRPVRVLGVRRLGVCPRGTATPPEVPPKGVLLPHWVHLQVQQHRRVQGGKGISPV